MQAKLVNKVVIKRNGHVVDWDSFRIQTAVFKAAINGKYKDKPLHANKIEIETIQNQVIKQLNDFDKDLARDFLAYKTKQNIEQRH